MQVYMYFTKQQHNTGERSHEHLVDNGEAQHSASKHDIRVIIQFFIIIIYT